MESIKITTSFRPHFNIQYPINYDNAFAASWTVVFKFSQYFDATWNKITQDEPILCVGINLKVASRE